MLTNAVNKKLMTRDRLHGRVTAKYDNKWLKAGSIGTSVNVVISLESPSQENS
jgi:hypothetical protein